METEELLDNLREFARTLMAEQRDRDYREKKGAVEEAIEAAKADIGRMLLHFIRDEDPFVALAGASSCGDGYGFNEKDACIRIPSHPGLHRNASGDVWNKYVYGCYLMEECVRANEHVGKCMDKDNNIITTIKSKLKRK